MKSAKGRNRASLSPDVRESSPCAQIAASLFVLYRIVLWFAVAFAGSFAGSFDSVGELKGITRFLLLSVGEAMCLLKRKGEDIMVKDMKPCHQFVVSNDAGVVIRCCVHCGLSHQMGKPGKLSWELILEGKGDETFARPCPAEKGSDDLFPYHHFILSNHYSRQWGIAVVIRFCVRCGLSHLLDAIALRDLEVQVQYPLVMPMSVPCWRHIPDKERDMTVSDLCPVEQGSDALERRHRLVPDN